MNKKEENIWLIFLFGAIFYLVGLQIYYTPTTCVNTGPVEYTLLSKACAQEPSMEPEITSLGFFTITHYCIENYPHICNNGNPSNTASGTVTTPYRTVAVDKSQIPWFTELVIQGQHYVAEDVGGAIGYNRIDICVTTHAEAEKLGLKENIEVFVVTKNGKYEVFCEQEKLRRG